MCFYRITDGLMSFREGFYCTTNFFFFCFLYPCRAQLRDPEVVAALIQQNVKMARLLPPTGTDVFKPFTLESLAEIERRMAEEAAEQEQMKAQNIEVAEEDLPKPTSDLEAGKALPFIYGDPPPNLLNVPLEELDPFYKAKKVSGKKKIPK